MYIWCAFCLKRKWLNRCIYLLNLKWLITWLNDQGFRGNKIRGLHKCGFWKMYVTGSVRKGTTYKEICIPFECLLNTDEVLINQVGKMTYSVKVDQPLSQLS